MPHRHPGSDPGMALPPGGMHHAPILNITFFPDIDGTLIPAQHDGRPDPYIGGQLDLADDDGTGVDPSAGVNLGGVVEVFFNHHGEGSIWMTMVEQAFATATVTLSLAERSPCLDTAPVYT